MSKRSGIYLILLLPALAFAQAGWWTPEEPEAGDPVTIHYDANVGTIPAGSTGLILHWGVDQDGPGGWQTPPMEIWPEGTTPWSDNIAARTPLTSEGGGLWSVTIEPLVETVSIHFVVTDGTNWDNNSDQNWDIWFGDPPVFDDVWHRFFLDPNSAHYTGGSVPNSVNVAGTFNNWSMSATPLTQHASGVWYADTVVPEGTVEYKFVIDGSQWVVDPDNPNNNPDDNNNSLLEAVPNIAPVFTSFNRAENFVTDQAGAVEIKAAFRDSDTGSANDWSTAEARVNGSLVPSTVEGDSIVASIDMQGEGYYDLRFDLLDEDNGDVTRVHYAAGYWTEGWHAVDPSGDDDGPGLWSYPTPFSGYADLLALHLWQAAEGDSMLLAVDLDFVHEYSRVQVALLSDIQAGLASDHIADELQTPDWQNGGVFMQLVSPTSGSLDPAEDNRLVLSHDPADFGVELDVWQEDDRLYARLPMDLLEERLGSWQEEWYIGAWTTLDGIAPVEGGAFELYPAQGGEDTAWDCDVYDAMNFGMGRQENRLLANNSITRTSALDAEHRGFAGVLPSDVGPNMAAPGPVVRILSRGGSTLASVVDVAGTVTPNAVGDIRLVRGWDGGEDTTLVTPVDGDWETSIVLQEGDNSFQALAIDGLGEWGSSAATVFHRIVDHTPRPAVDVSLHEDGYIRLYGGGTIDIDGDIASWAWTEEPGNPQSLNVLFEQSQIARIEALPSLEGEYRMRLTVTDEEGNSDYAIGMFEVEDGEILPVGDDGYPTWVRDAVIYEIFVRSYDPARSLDAVTARLEELVDLGVNCIWFMPIFEGPTDHGYEIVDYLNIEADYGTLEDFQELVEAAHELGIRVVLDMVINHSGIGHPWFQEALEFGEHSLYHDYYDFNPDGSHQYYYDWFSLPNFNVSSADLRREVNAMCRYWVEEIGVDGFRCDVAWGPMERDAQFWNDWRKAIRQKRPDLLLLAEAGSNDFSIYENRFNLAYDWDFFWQVIGNIGSVGPSTVHDRVSNFGFWQPDNALAFRFLENHDEDRLINSVSEDVLRLGAALNFTIPGVPLIYAGQEVGETSPRGMIDWSDPLQLRPYYEHLIDLRLEYPQFRTNRVTRVDNSQSGSVYSFLRQTDEPWNDGAILCAFNFSPNGREAAITVDPVALGMDEGTWYLTNLMNGDVMQYDDGLPDSLPIQLAGHEPGIYLVADESVEVSVEEPRAVVSDFELGNAYPNPFNPRTRIPFSLPQRSELRLEVYNIQGQHVQTLVDGTVEAGRHLVEWRPQGLASGVYVLRASAPGWSESRKLLLLK